MQEYQRTKRNKNTIINQTYISGGEFRNKFDKIVKNKNVSRILYMNMVIIWELLFAMMERYLLIHLTKKFVKVCLI